MTTIELIEYLKPIIADGLKKGIKYDRLYLSSKIKTDLHFFTVIHDISVRCTENDKSYLFCSDLVDYLDVIKVIPLLSEEDRKRHRERLIEKGIVKEVEIDSIETSPTIKDFKSLVDEIENERFNESISNPQVEASKGLKDLVDEIDNEESGSFPNVHEIPGYEEFRKKFLIPRYPVEVHDSKLYDLLYKQQQVHEKILAKLNELIYIQRNKDKRMTC